MKARLIEFREWNLKDDATIPEAGADVPALSTGGTVDFRGRTCLMMLGA